MKKILIFLILGFYYKISIAQKPNWQNLDLQKDSVFGISTERAYGTLLLKKKPQSVIVAIIDTGIDTAQEDLSHLLWTDPVSGAHGRSYIASERGKEDITNMALVKKDLYDSLSYTTVPEIYRADYQAHRRTAKEYESHYLGMEILASKLKLASAQLQRICNAMDKADPTSADLKAWYVNNPRDSSFTKLLINKLTHYKNVTELKKHEIDELLQLAEYHLSHGLSMKDVEVTAEDLENDPLDIENGAIGLIEDQNQITYHGTHVAGIIAAERNNDKGMNGIADDVQIMMLKVLSNVRELRDDSLAAAIRYAVDHGAKIINLSFGKPYTWSKQAVDDAVAYAMANDVLVIHAAGNAGDDLDKKEHYPNPIYLNGKGQARAWLEVGASGWKDDSTLAADFSNYGKNSVDLFAPGVQIYSTLPFNQYSAYSGTSMAAPVVSGVAALIREYYPGLSAVQVKEIIMHSVVKRDILNNKCVSGGVVNAYNALRLAASYKK